MGAPTDFLHGYYYALVIVALCIGGLYYFGIFEKTECVINSSFSCSDLSASANGLSFSLTNKMNITLSDVVINVSGCGSSSIQNIDQHQKRSIQYTCSLPKKFSSNISVQYVKSNDTKHIYLTQGKIQGKIN